MVMLRNNTASRDNVFDFVGFNVIFYMYSGRDFHIIIIIIALAFSSSY